MIELIMRIAATVGLSGVIGYTSVCITSPMAWIEMCIRDRLNTLAFVIFSVFGVYTFYQGFKLISTGVCPIPVWPGLIVVTVAFAVLCVCLFVRREKKVK